MGRLRGLDALNFFVANVQTGFGPFIAVYLTTEAWTQAEIGQALSVGTAAAMLSQLPGGALVDRLQDKRVAAAAASLAVAASAVLFAAAPIKPVVMLAEVLHASGSAMLGPAIAAITLGLVGYAALGERLGRNARLASLGNGSAAAVLGVCGAYVSSRAVFWLTAALMVPALLSLRFIGKGDAAPAMSGARDGARGGAFAGMAGALRDRRLLAFAGCAGLFNLANAALLPLAASNITRAAGSMANLLVAGCIILPQILVAVISPAVGREADRRRRLVLAVGFGAVPLRAVLLALIGGNPSLLVAVQTLDGVSAAAFGVMLPLIAADLTRGTGRFNLCMGIFGLAAAGGATLSTLLAGQVADAVGEASALLTLAACGAVATLGAVGFTLLPQPLPGPHLGPPPGPPAGPIAAAAQVRAPWRSAP